MLGFEKYSGGSWILLMRGYANAFLMRRSWYEIVRVNGLLRRVNWRWRTSSNVKLGFWHQIGAALNSMKRSRSNHLLNTDLVSEANLRLRSPRTCLSVGLKNWNSQFVAITLLRT